MHIMMESDMVSEQHAEQPSRNQVIDLLGTIIDPELGIDIVQLGLVYSVSVFDGNIEVLMTLTTPTCPMGNYLVNEVNGVLQRRFGSCCSVDVKLVWEPQWKPEMMSDKAKTFLGWT